MFIPGIAGPKFSRLKVPAMNATTLGANSSELPHELPIVRALVVEYESTQPFTMSYHEIENFTSSVERWFERKISTAPPGMRDGFFISELSFYDLQRTLSRGTIMAIAIAMTTSLVVLLIVTLNVFVSIIAVVTVTLTILSTIACFVLLGWKLNILESIIFSTAIGLAVDFTLHYGVNYRLSPMTDRESAVRYSLSRMIGPTVMAAVTTGAAGAFMIPSNILAYIQIGSFLFIVMCISWLYATFFFSSVLLKFGPQHGYGQFRMPKIHAKDNKLGKNNVEYSQRMSAQGTVSEQLLSASSSAAGEFIGSESHELSSIHSNSVIKGQSGLETRPVSFDRSFKKRFSTFSRDQSPTSTSAITEVYPTEDGDFDRSHI